MNDSTNLNLEQSLIKLEEVVTAMESGESSLESSITLYKEGLRLSKHCNEMLGRFEAEITMLRQEADGSIIEESVEADYA